MEDHLKGTDEGWGRVHPNHSDGVYDLGEWQPTYGELKRLVNRAKRHLWNLERRLKFSKRIPSHDHELLDFLRGLDARSPKK